jgi:hypothetical protein
VDEINARMIDSFLGKATVFYSFDLVDDDECNNSITPNCLPPHELKIKINCPLILLRNQDPCSGLCNGTRLVLRAVDKHILEEGVSYVSEFCDDYQQGTGPDAAHCWCISTGTSLFTWVIKCCFIEVCVSRIHLGSM